MRALTFADGMLRFVDDYPTPAPGSGEALVRVRMAGICNTDLEITRGYMGFEGVLGHEFVGVVEQTTRKELVGRRVVGEINCACGACDVCIRGLERHCPHRTVLGILHRDGAFADFLTLPERNLHIVPDGISDEEAVFTELLAATFEILEQLPIGTSDRVAVLGDGKLGLLVAQTLAATGCELLLLGKHVTKLTIAYDLGIPTASVECNAERDFDVVVDCTGSAAGFVTACELTRPRGTVVLKSTVADRAELNLAKVVIDELTVVGSRCGPFPPALEALRGKRVQVAPLISGRYPLSEGIEAFENAAAHGMLKILLDVS